MALIKPPAAGAFGERSGSGGQSDYSLSGSRGITVRNPRHVWLFVLLLGAALAVRVAIVVATRHARPQFDAGDYVRIGQSIAAGHGFGASLFASGPSAFRPPGYPVFVAAVFSIFGHSLLALRLIESVLGVFSVAALGFISLRIWGTAEAIIAVALGAVYLPLGISGVAMVSEAVFIPLALASIAAMLHALSRGGSVAWLATSGFLAGVAWLTRDNGIVLLLPLLLLARHARPSSPGPARGVRTALRQRLAAPGVVLAAFVIAVIPWTVRNAYVMHAFVPVSTESWYTLASEYNNLSLRHPSQFYDPGITSTYGRFFPERGLFVRRSRLTEPRVDAMLRGPVLRFIGAHLSFVPTAVLANLKHMARRLPEGELPGSGLSSGIAFYVLVLLFLASLFTRAVRRIPIWLWLTGACMLLPIFFAATTIRLRAPLDPFLILVASAGIAAAVCRLRGASSAGSSSRASS